MDRFAFAIALVKAADYRSWVMGYGEMLLEKRVAELPLEPEWRVIRWHMRMEQGKQRTEARFLASVELDFLDWRAIAVKREIWYFGPDLRKIPVSSTPEQCRKLFFQRSEEVLQELVEQFIRNLRTALLNRDIPVGRFSYGRIWTDVRDRRLPAFQETFGQDPMHFVQEVLEARQENWVEATLDLAREKIRGAWPGEAPSWLRPAEAVVCRYEADLTYDLEIRVVCRMRLRWSQEAEVTAKAVGVRIPQLTRTVPPERIREEMGTILEDLARKAREEAVERMATYEMVASPPAWREIPEGRAAWTLLTKGSAQLGRIQVRLTKGTEENREGFGKRPPEGAHFFWMGEDRCLLSPLPDFNPNAFPRILLGVTDPEHHGSLLAMMKALGAVAEWYGALDPQGTVNPALTFWLSSEGLCGFRFADRQEGLQIPGEDFVRDPAQWGQDFFASRLSLMQEREAEVRRHQEALERSNEVQLGMIQYIYRNEQAYWRICQQTLLDEYGDHPLFSQAAVERYAKEILKLTLCVEGRWEPVITIRQEHLNRPRWGRSWDDERNRYRPDYFAYWSLHPNPAINPDWILGLSPRRTSQDDWADLRTSDRQDWLAGEGAEIVESGDRERCWAFVSALPEKTSKAAAAAFLKSDGGQECLRMLTGADREYALLLLEDLPGCKRLAAALRREAEEDSVKDGAGDSGESSPVGDAAPAPADSPESPASS